MPIDRRIKKTKTAITNATVELLAEHPINKLTIKEICDSANISRSTFYLHFYDAYDVISNVYDNISISISKLLDNFDFTIILSNPRPFLVEVIDFIKSNFSLYFALTKANYHSDFRRKLTTILKDKVLQENHYRFHDQVEFNYSVSYIISGLVETICNFILDLNTPNVTKLIDTLTKQISTGFSLQ